MRYRRLLPLVAVLLCTGVPVSFADQVVYFVNGKAIMVKSVEKGDKFTVLEMDGGGRIGVPTDQISRIEDYVVSAPAAVPPQVPAVPVAVQAGSLPQPAPIPGPGVGGPPAGGPSQSVAVAQPPIAGRPAEAQRPPARPGGANGGAGGRMMGPGAGRPNFMAGGHRPGGRATLLNGRGAGRLADLNRNAPPPGATSAPPSAPGGAPVPVAPVPVAPAPTAGSQPEEPPSPPDDPNNEEPDDPTAPEEGDSSGSTPGGPS